MIVFVQNCITGNTKQQVFINSFETTAIKQAVLVNLRLLQISRVHI